MKPDVAVSKPASPVGHKSEGEWMSSMIHRTAAIWENVAALPVQCGRISHLPPVK